MVLCGQGQVQHGSRQTHLITVSMQQRDYFSTCRTPATNATAAAAAAAAAAAVLKDATFHSVPHNVMRGEDSMHCPPASGKSCFAEKELVLLAL